MAYGNVVSLLPTPPERTVRRRGFSLVETVVVLGIAAMVAAIGLAIFTPDRSAKFDGQVQNLLAELRQSQANARTVDNNKEYGVSFTSTSYTTFSRDPSNGSQTSIKTTTLSNATLAAVLTPVASSIIFDRLTGRPQNNTMATLTLTTTNPSRQKIIKVENTGVMYVQ